jgi:cytochrome c biogenesis protein CcdA
VVYKTLIGSDTSNNYSKWKIFFRIWSFLVPLAIALNLIVNKNSWLGNLIHTKVFIIVAYMGGVVIICGAIMVFLFKYYRKGSVKAQENPELKVADEVELSKIKDLRLVVLFFIFGIVAVILSAVS